MPEPITWTCAECGQLIADGEGALGIDPQNVPPEPEGDEFGLISFADLPEDRPWSALHFACTLDGQPIGDGESYSDPRFTYAIEVERLRTVGQLLRWSLHVGEKTWASGTDWTTVMHAAADRAGVPQQL